jgi:hypothetical protein
MDESAMENSAGASCIDCIHLNGRKCETLIPNPGHCACSAQRHCQKTVELISKRLESLWRVSQAGEFERKILTANQKIDFSEQRLTVVKRLVQINTNGDSCFLIPDY